MTHDKTHADCNCCVDTSLEAVTQLIEEGTIAEFDAANGAIKFDGTLHNKGTIIIRTSDASFDVAELHATHIFNDGKIISELPVLKLSTETVQGWGEISAPTTVEIVSTVKDLSVVDNIFTGQTLDLVCDGVLKVYARSVEGLINLTANLVSVGVRSGDLNIGSQTVTDDPLYYNKSGNVSITMPPTGGADIFAMASGDVTCGSLDTSQGDDTTYGRISLSSGVQFVNTGGGQVNLSCIDCLPLVYGDPDLEQVSGPNPMAGSVTVTGNLTGKSIFLGGAVISVSGNIHATGVDHPQPGGGAVQIFAESSISVEGTITADPDENDEPGSVFMVCPEISVEGKITTGSLSLDTRNYSETESGTITTADIEATRFVGINAGGVILGGGGSLSETQNLFQGDFTIETGDITAKEYILLTATNTILTGAVSLLENDDEESFEPHTVRIHANVEKESGAAEFKIGQGGTNGPASITVEGVKDNFGNKTGGIFVSNGPAGDIAIDGEALIISHEQEGTPNFIAHAGDGNITITNSLNFDGTSTVPSGSIALMADEIIIGETTSITANSTVEEPESVSPVVIIAANTITLHSNLSVECIGNFFTAVRIAPKGSLEMDPMETPGSSDLRPQYANFLPADDELSFTGEGNLIVTVDSGAGSIEIGGSLIEMDAGTVDLKAFGDFATVNFSYQGSASGTDSLVMSGGKVTITINDPENAIPGTLSISTDQINISTEVEINMDSVAEGKGGSAYITTTGGGIDISGSLKISANGDGSEEGGDIQIISEGGLVFSTLDLDANGGSADGAGGSITITTNEDVDFSTIDSQIISAAGGGDSGDGGAITILKPVGLDVHEVLTVAAGPSFTNALACFVECADKRTKTLRGVTCKSWPTGNAIWPKEYWTTANIETEGSDSEIAVAAALLRSNMRTSLASMNLQIYSMENMTEFNAFFGVNLADTQQAGASIESKYLSAALRTQVTMGDNEPYLTGTIIHEIGHQLENHLWVNDAYTNSNWSDGSTGARDLDELAFNAGTCAAMVDADRTSNSLPSICGVYPGTNKEKLNNKLEMASDEQWARAFTEVLRQQNSTVIFVPPYVNAVEARFPNEIAYMVNLHSTGHP